MRNCTNVGYEDFNALLKSPLLKQLEELDLIGTKMHEHSFKTLLEQKLPLLKTFGFDQIDLFFKAAYSMYFTSKAFLSVT